MSIFLHRFSKYKNVNIPPLYFLGNNCTKYQNVNIPQLYFLGNNCTKYQNDNIPPLYLLGNCSKYQNVNIPPLYIPWETVPSLKMSIFLHCISWETTVPSIKMPIFLFCFSWETFPNIQMSTLLCYCSKYKNAIIPPLFSWKTNNSKYQSVDILFAFVLLYIKLFYV